MPQVVVLPSELTIHGASALRGELLAALDAACAARPGAVLALAAGAVDEVDAAGLQVLVALAHACRDRDCELQFADASEALRHAMGALGLLSFSTMNEGALA